MTNPAIAAAFPKARFVVTICVGSFLLFLVQPMIARMALPRLGGAPAVWNSAMLVYQALLLAGYAYAHWLGRFAGRRQAVIHLGLFAVAAIMLPIGLSTAIPPAEASPFVWVPWLLLSSIGPLFFVVSAQAPLMQRWFANSGGGDPYPLYAASNLGSFAGLIAYPLLVEPFLRLENQSLLWTAGYLALAALVALCALSLRAVVPAGAVQEQTQTPIDRREIAYWILLSAIPSGLMLSTTTHLTTDIVAMPLLWVLPLGLYLLSFTIAFAEKRGLANWISARTPLVILAGGAATFIDSTQRPLFFACLGLILLFTVSIALHTRLFERRPDPSRLTGFYLAMSFGGVLGGLFCALVAPVIFDWGYEHPVLVLAAAALLAGHPIMGFVGKIWGGPSGPLRIGLWLIVAALFLSLIADDMMLRSVPDWAEKVAIAMIAIAAIAALGQRVLFPALLGILMLSLGGWATLGLSLAKDARQRSFFGIYTVATSRADTRTLIHGTTVHGIQNLARGEESSPTSYYAPKSGVGLAMVSLPALFGDKARVGVVGLGAGTLACYAKPGQQWKFFEIDPVVIGIARNPAQFTFLSRCAPDVPIVVGDARLTLTQDRGAPFDLLAIDAFSSDAIPMHLLTQEAFAIYGQKLTKNGLLLVHISNRYLDLEPVLASLVDTGWSGMIRAYGISDAEKKRNLTSSIWVALSHDPSTLDKLKAVSNTEGWRPLKARAGFTPWSDDYSSILPLLKMGKQPITRSTDASR